MKFIIPRNKWVNSHHGKGPTKLLNKEGYQCCLGFCCEQLGAPKHQLLNCGSPESLFRYNKTFDLNHIFISPNSVGIWSNTNTVLATCAIRINDDNSISLQEKEAKLTKLFKEFDLEIEFVGEYEVDS